MSFSGKEIDFKSMVIGFLLAVVLFLLIGAAPGSDGVQEVRIVNSDWSAVPVKLEGVRNIIPVKIESVGDELPVKLEEVKYGLVLDVRQK